jgi:hypothetical protein
MGANGGVSVTLMSGPRYAQASVPSGRPTHWTGGWVGSRFGQNVTAQRNCLPS